MRWQCLLGLSVAVGSMAVGCGAFSDHDPKVAGQGEAESPDALSVGEATRLIPSAAAIPTETLERFVTDPPSTVSGIEDQRLTALVLAMDPESAAREDARVLGDFRYISAQSPTPQKILRTVRSGDGTATIIRPEYIVDCTCRSEDGRAEGVVTFRAPGVYEGQAEFTAERADGRWRVTGFRMPAYRLETRRTSDGTWQLAGDPLLAGSPIP
jgi:hypothetical protein